MSFVCWRLISRSEVCLKSALKFSCVWRATGKGRFSHLSSVAYLWGAGDAGQLGTGTQEPSLLPVKLSVSEEQILQVGCGFGFTIVADAVGSRIWSTGLNTFFQLGRQLTGGQFIDTTPSAIDLPTTMSSGHVKQISCGRSHSAILTEYRKVFTCGGHYHGQCGLGRVDSGFVKRFTEIPGICGKIIKQIACGLDHTLLLTLQGEVLSCGWGADGQTGLGHFKDESTFKPVEGSLKNVKIKQVATTVDCCLALSVEGEVFSWGNNEYNQLATASNEEQLAVPTVASLLRNLPKIKQVSAGGSNCVALTVSGELYSWGYGVLGHGQEVSFTKMPRKIEAFDKIDEAVIAVSCGPDYTAVITDSGVLYTWGRGAFGRLGHGSNEDQWVPKKVALPGKVVGVSCGVDHMAVIATSK